MVGLSPQKLQDSRRKAKSVNRVLCWVLPVMALGAGADLAGWSSRVNAPLVPLSPSLEELGQSLPEAGAPGLSAGVFEEAVKPAPVAAVKPSEVPVAPEAAWKLLGVVTAGGKRVFLEVEGGKGVWATEGETVGSTRVKEIRERSVILEGKDGEYEIRM